MNGNAEKISTTEYLANERPPVAQFTGYGKYEAALHRLRAWIEERDYAGHEPYDLLNSPYFSAPLFRTRFASSVVIQVGRRWGGLRLRHWLGVPASKNPKGLALCLLAYCDLARRGIECRNRVCVLKHELRRLRSPGQGYLSWGYDWDFVSLRGTVMRKFSPNCIATCFAAEALLDMAEIFGDADATSMAQSAGEFVVRCLNRTVDTENCVCFSYTPADRTKIYNSSVIAGALLARLGAFTHNTEYLNLARCTMRYLADHQARDGSWTYGAGRGQKWIDGFHTGYNLCALLRYQQLTGDLSFDPALDRGYAFYKHSLIRNDGSPKYFHNGVYPIDIHACAQAILTFCTFRERDPEALTMARRTADWTLENMRSHDGTFFYQRHRWRTDRTPYMRWGQAWMFRALARLQNALREYPQAPTQEALVLSSTH